jgi:hypothetical protein
MQCSVRGSHACKRIQYKKDHLPLNVLLSISYFAIFPATSSIMGSSLHPACILYKYSSRSINKTSWDTCLNPSPSCKTAPACLKRISRSYCSSSNGHNILQDAWQRRLTMSLLHSVTYCSSALFTVLACLRQVRNL